MDGVTGEHGPTGDPGQPGAEGYPGVPGMKGLLLSYVYSSKILIVNIKSMLSTLAVLF